MQKPRICLRGLRNDETSRDERLDRAAHGGLFQPKDVAQIL